MAIYLYGQYSDFDKLVIDIKSKQNGNVHVSYLKLDDNTLVTSENAEVWARYLFRKLEILVTKKAMESVWNYGMANFKFEF